LPDDELVLSSDQQGGLGVGHSVPLSVLEPGTHVITLAAKDSFGVETY
jgi:hypothetical protein